MNSRQSTHYSSRQPPGFLGQVVLMSALLITVVSGTLSAQPASDSPGTLLILSNVANTAIRDTRIFLSNTSNLSVFLSCVLVDGTTDQQANFDIVLPRQSSLTWLASAGWHQRNAPCGASPTCIIPLDYPADDNLTPPHTLIPPIRSGFDGHLRCLTVGSDGVTPIALNSLLGTTTATALVGGDEAQANGATFRANVSSGGLNGDGQLYLGDGPDAEIDGCAMTWDLTHSTPGADTLLPGATADTVLFVVVCWQDFYMDVTGEAFLQLEVTNEFENRLSVTTNVHGYRALSLSNLNLTVAMLGSEVASTRIASSAGITVVGEERIESINSTARTAINATYHGDSIADDLIVWPPTRGPVYLWEP